jgi:predicted glutamine amidotransferase
MCRLLGLLAAETSPPSWGLSEAPLSLLRQSDADPRRKQADGWGLGWYDHGVQVVRSTQAIFSEPSRAARVGRHGASAIAIAHIRRASNPLRQPHASLVRPENIQPFAFGRYLFAHNGTLHFPREAAKLLGSWADSIEGTNDSEVLFWTTMMLLCRHRSVPRGLAALPAHLERVRSKLPRDQRDWPVATGLNIVLSDSRRLFAFACGPESPGRDRVALCSPAWPYWTLAYRLRRGNLWIASEPFDRDRSWSPIESGNLLSAWRSKGAVRYSIRPLRLRGRG